MAISRTKQGPVLASVIKQLKDQKYRPEFLDSVVPAWWTPDIEDDAGALAHVKLVLARILGLNTQALLKDNKVVPVTPTGMQFKRSIELQKTAPPNPNLAYYSRIAKAIASGMEPSLDVPLDPYEMHSEILEESGEACITLKGIIEYCWSRNIAVVHVHDVPVGKKGFDALVYPHEQRYVIFLARRMGPESSAKASFIIAHELGHIAMGHVAENTVLIDDPSGAERQKGFEPQADDFASKVLSGGRYNKSWRGRALSPDLLADRAMEYGEEVGIDPGHILLRYAFESGDKGYGSPIKALKLIDTFMECDVHEFVNDIARQRIPTEPISKDAKALLDRSILAA